MKKSIATLIVLALLALPFAVALVSCGGGGGSGGTSPSTVTGTATLSWTAPDKKSDGTDLNDLAGCRIHYGTASGSYPQTIDIPCTKGENITYQVTNLPAGYTYYFVVTAYNTYQAESDYSNEGSKSI